MPAIAFVVHDFLNQVQGLSSVPELKLTLKLNHNSQMQSATQGRLCALSCNLKIRMHVKSNNNVEGTE